MSGNAATATAASATPAPAPRIAREARRPAVHRLPACQTVHREELLHGLHLARLANRWDVVCDYPAETVAAKKLRLTREESRAIEKAAQDYGVGQRQVIAAALHFAGRDRLSKTFAPDCRVAAGGCAVTSCRAEFSCGRALEAPAAAPAAETQTLDFDAA